MEEQSRGDRAVGIIVGAGVGALCVMAVKIGEWLVFGILVAISLGGWLYGFGPASWRLRARQWRWPAVYLACLLLLVRFAFLEQLSWYARPALHFAIGGCAALLAVSLVAIKKSAGATAAKERRDIATFLLQYLLELRAAPTVSDQRRAMDRILGLSEMYFARLPTEQNISGHELYEACRHIKTIVRDDRPASELASELEVHVRTIVRNNGLGRVFDLIKP